MSLSKRRRIAEKRIANKRAKQFEGKLVVDTGGLTVQPPSKEHPHKSPGVYDANRFKDWNGGCDCAACKDLKRKRYKGERKREWKEWTSEELEQWESEDPLNGLE